MNNKYIGLMSGTSLDGVDAVLAKFDANDAMQIMGATSLPYSAQLRADILALQTVGDNELARAAKLANQLANLYAQAVNNLLATCACSARQIRAIACHGQTIRHAPQDGYSYQIGNLAKLAELSNIDVIGDFRSRDIAASGQGAPLVPAFHHYCFGCEHEARAILNLGGIANLTALIPQKAVFGFDCGPGNMLMDAWISQHQPLTYDENGAWAATGRVHSQLLESLLSEEYFQHAPPKSCGRDLFNLLWLAQHLARFPEITAPQDVQATLLALTVNSVARAINDYLPEVSALYVCGGGANNLQLMQTLQQKLPALKVDTTDKLALPTQQVEPAAFAWLAYRFSQRLCANLPEVTGARGSRILGALYPA